MIPTQQMDLVNTQLLATQHQLQQTMAQYEELRVHHQMLLQEVLGLQKTVVNHEHVMQNVMNFLHSVDAQRRRDSRVANPFAQQGPSGQNGNAAQSQQPQDAPEDDVPASPLQHASKLLSETNADLMLNPRNLEQMNELSMKYGTFTTPPPEYLRNGRPNSRSGPPHSASSTTSGRMNEIDSLVYPIGQTQGIDPMFSDHVHNIPYPMPAKQEPAPQQNASVPGSVEMRKKSTLIDPGWIRKPQVLLVEDDPTCRRIGGKFLQAFNCNISYAVSELSLMKATSLLTFPASSMAWRPSTK